MSLNEIEGEIMIAPTGEIALRITKGTFETGSNALQRLAAAMRANNVTIGDILPEQHRHDKDDHNYVHHNEPIKIGR